MSIIVIGNPASGRSSLRKLKKVLSLLKSHDPDAKLFITEGAGDAERLSKEAVLNSPQLIISAGGDSTCNEVINGTANSDIPTAILPMGIANVLAKELGISMELKKSISQALNGSVHSVSLGKITFNNKSRYFSLMAGIGYDAEAVLGVMGSMKPEIRKLLGKSSYIISGIKKLFSWNPEELTINLNGKSYQCYSLIVCNSSRYAGNFMVAPDAHIEKPLLYAILMHGGRKIDIMRYTMAIIRERHLRLNDITYLPCSRIEITGSAGIQVDGDYIGRTPAHIDISPDAVRLVY